MTSNTTIAIDRGRALDLLAGAVKNRGADYVYPNAVANLPCHYVNSGQPDCMVAQALSDAGVSIDVLDSLDNLGGIAESAVLRELQINGVILTPGAIAAFNKAQERQDLGNTWGSAYAAASGTPATP